ncbi:uncharacterized protein LOC114254963 [Monomorium pharaonis]|uniref:uncharacterized protein LOC114254963 n=1 Tax=Monomorium pharaonis TaxID=307658 RepID=UPI001746939C|nr:uncharacterized protein LOC114254963 [Monomorium pharaonis]
MTKKTLSMDDEAARALRVSEERLRRGEGGSCRRRSQSKLSRGYVFCANQVTNRGLSAECSSDDCVDNKWEYRRNLDELKAPKAQGRNKSGSSTETAVVDFYARQVCCRECG